MEIKTEPMKKAMFLIVFAIFTWWLFDNFRFVGSGLNILLGILSPFIIGLAVAFILNKPMIFIEEKLFGKNAHFNGIKEKYKRPISFLITLLVFILVLAIILILVIPNLIGAGEQITDKVPKYFEILQEYIEKSSTKYPQVNEEIQKIDLEKMTDNILNFIKGGFSNWIGSTFTIFSSVVGVLFSIGLGFVFAIYFLLQKEELILSIKKLIFSVFPIKIANRLIYIGKITRDSFSEFLTGQTLDALALGALFFISMIIFRFPYALMVSVIITIGAFIPIVGAFIGLAVGGFLIFVEDPRMAGFFLILFLVLQQIESNLIYPKVVGKASGLSSVWILAAVTLGGSLMGILGIILFVPLFSVAQKLLKEYTDRKLGEKNIEIVKENNS